MAFWRKVRRSVPYGPRPRTCPLCGGRIPPRYLLVEVAGVVVAAVALGRLGPTGEAARAAVLLWALVAIAAIDVEHLLIPDALNGAILRLGLVASGHGERGFAVSVAARTLGT